MGTGRVDALAAPVGERSLAEMLCAARDEYRVEIRLARGGAQAAENYSRRIDRLVMRIYAEASSQAGTPVALLAIGGYGRRHLCLHSDIDLMILFGGPIAAAEERFVKALLHPLWDLGFDVGHQVRQLSEFSQAETDNPEFLVAVGDSRFLTGDAGVFERFDTLVHGPESVWRQPTVEALFGLVAERHRHFNATIYQLEPDVKEAPGALRDVAAIRTFVALTQPGTTRSVPATSGRLVEALDEAEEFFLRLRSLLHLENRRNLNVLSHDDQEAVAERFGSPGGEARRQVEALMSVYFHHARIIARILAAAITEANPPPGPGTTKSVGDNILMSRDGIGFVDTVRASLQPRTWLGLFQAAIDHGCAVSPESLAFVERHGDRYTSEEFFPGTAERDTFLHFLTPAPGLYERLSELHQTGLLGRMFPESKINWKIFRITTTKTPEVNLAVTGRPARGWLGLALLGMLTGCGADLEVLRPDTVLLNGKIITVDEEFSIAEAVAIKDGRFVAVGSNAQIRNLARGDSRGGSTPPSGTILRLGESQRMLRVSMLDSYQFPPVVAAISK